MHRQFNAQISERIKQVRLALGMTQAQFGEKLGVSRGVVANVELCRAAVRDLFVDHLCEIFSVSRRWLLEGEGDMFLDSDAALLERLSRKYDLDDNDRRVISAYVRMSPGERAALSRLLDGLKAQDK